jgi:hypothetical protein
MGPIGNKFRGLDLNLVGWQHRCVPGVSEPALPLVANKVANADAVVANKRSSRRGNYRDLEKRRTYMREFMRKKRLAELHQA